MFSPLCVSMISPGLALFDRERARLVCGSSRRGVDQVVASLLGSSGDLVFAGNSVGASFRECPHGVQRTLVRTVTLVSNSIFLA